MIKQYLLVLSKDTTNDQFNNLLSKYNIKIDIDYEFLKRHYLVSFEESFKQDIKKEEIVVHVTEHDAPVEMTGTQEITTKFDATGDNWGLVRINRQGNWNDSGWFPVKGTYNYSRTGEGVDAYVVDTGIRRTHTDFAGRVEVIYDYYRTPSNPLYGEDVQGHGSHVASTVAGTKYGVAKKAKILVARIFDTGSAPLVAVIGGINAVLAHHQNKKNNNINRPSVMNLSIGGPKVTVEEQALNDCIENGILVVAAAGNDGKNLDDTTFNVLPAEIERAITVGAVDVKDRICSFSNYGSSLDLFAPGAYIAGAGIANDTAESVKSGTSMAAPHAAGVLVLRVQGESIGRDAAWVKTHHDWLISQSTVNTILLHEASVTTQTPNKMLYSPYSVSGIEEVIAKAPAPVVPAPVASSKKRVPVKLLRLISFLRSKLKEANMPQDADNSIETAFDELTNAVSKEEKIIALDKFFKAKKELDLI
jgi:subtilisin family serine protease